MSRTLGEACLFSLYDDARLDCNRDVDRDRGKEREREKKVLRHGIFLYSRIRERQRKDSAVVRYGTIVDVRLRRLSSGFV